MTVYRCQMVWARGAGCGGEWAVVPWQGAGLEEGRHRAGRACHGAERGDVLGEKGIQMAFPSLALVRLCLAFTLEASHGVSVVEVRLRGL